MLKLADDEYIGEEISAIYDRKYAVLMVQRNRNSLSPSGLEKYFSGILNTGTQIELKPIVKPEELNQISPNQTFRKLNLSFAPTKIDDELLEQKNKSIYSIINGSRKMGALNVTITFSLGNEKKGKSLSKDEILDLKNMKLSDGFSKIQVFKKDNEDTRVEMVDLLNPKLYDIVRMQISREFPILYNRTIIEMLALYKEKVVLFKKIFKEIRNET